MEQIEEAASAVRELSGLKPRIGIVLGTGLGALADGIEVAVRIPYEEIPHFPVSTLDAKGGELLLGRLAGKEVAALSVRSHCYEGHSLRQVTFPVRVLKALGVRTLVLSNAAGGLNPQFSLGDIMVITDHINLMGDNPLVGPNDDRLGPRFPDMSEPYSKGLIDLAESVALSKGIQLRRGVYLACVGPSLETRAEYRFMRLIGADTVGMGTVPEVIVCVHAGLRVLAFSVVTDLCFPDALEPVDVSKVIATANRAEPVLAELIAGCIGKMSL